MSEETETFETTTSNIENVSHTRILFLMGLIAVLLSIYCFVFVSANFGVGVLIGGVLAFANYYWLKHSIKVVFKQAEKGEVSSFAGSRYILRYLIFGLVLFLIYLTNSISVIAIILGLASFAFAVVLEGFIRIFATFKK